MQRFKEGQHVTWNHDAWRTKVNRGIVRGYSSVPMAVLGSWVIIELIEKTPNSFSCIVLPEIALRKAIDSPAIEP